MKSNKEINEPFGKSFTKTDDIKEIFEKFEKLNDLSEDVTETKYDYGEWVIKFDNLVNQLKSQILQKIKELEEQIEIKNNKLSRYSLMLFEKDKEIKELNQKIKEFYLKQNEGVRALLDTLNFKSLFSKGDKERLNEE